ETDLRVVRFRRELGAEALDVAGIGRLAGKLERRSCARNRRRIGFRGRDEGERLLGAGEVSRLDVALGEARQTLHVLAILLEHLSEELGRGVEIARSERRL